MKIAEVEYSKLYLMPEEQVKLLHEILKIDKNNGEQLK